MYWDVSLLVSLVTPEYLVVLRGQESLQMLQVAVAVIPWLVLVGRARSVDQRAPGRGLVGRLCGAVHRGGDLWLRLCHPVM